MIDPRLSRLATRADLLGPAEERDLLRQAKAGHQPSRDRLVITHMRLAVAAAARFRNYGITVDDLVHEGIAGLLAAIDGFDIAQEVRFSTYAVWWVRAKISDHVMKQSGPVAMATTPANKAMFFKLRAERAKLERCGTLSPAQVNAKLAEVFDVSVERIRMASAYFAAGSVSLDEPMTPDGDERGAMLADETDGVDVLAEAEIDGQHRRNGLRLALATLSERERDIVMARHLGNDEAETLDALGRRFSISKERVRQIEAKALEKLKGKLNSDGTLRRALITA